MVKLAPNRIFLLSEKQKIIKDFQFDLKNDPKTKDAFESICFKGDNPNYGILGFQEGFTFMFCIKPIINKGDIITTKPPNFNIINLKKKSYTDPGIKGYWIQFTVDVQGSDKNLRISNLTTDIKKRKWIHVAGILKGRKPIFIY